MDFTISAQKFALGCRFDNRYVEINPIKNPKHA